MNYTENYHLPQWDETDRVLRTDFNQMCADIEAGLDQGVAGTAEAEARVQAGVDRVEAAAARAQAKADAAYSPSQPPYVVGSYQGTDGTVHITLGFTPRFLIISGGTTDDYFILAGQQTSDASEYLEFTSDGFTVKRHMANPGTSSEYPLAPHLSSALYTYSYIAFR